MLSPAPSSDLCVLGAVFEDPSVLQALSMEGCQKNLEKTVDFLKEKLVKNGITFDIYWLGLN